VAEGILVSDTRDQHPRHVCRRRALGGGGTKGAGASREEVAEAALLAAAPMEPRLHMAHSR